MQLSAPSNMDEAKQQGEEKQESRKWPTISTVLDNGSIVELLYDPREKRTSFAVWTDGAWRRQRSLEIGAKELLVPYSPQNNLIQHHVVLLPSQAEEYGSEEELIASIREYIHRYVDVSPRFERIACLYVLLSWVYDSFNEVPYLRLRGDFGSGKTRFLLTVGALCYKAVFASGASTVSPIFHILDAFRGTLILDEGDFRFSDKKAEIVKILNNGNVRGLPVLRTQVTPQREFNPRAFHVFGPKMIAMRGTYEDRALESRFITENMARGRLREDIPISLNSAYKEEALSLRNKLLLYRFRNYGMELPDGLLDDASIEPRFRQIFIPLLAVARDPCTREELHRLALAYHRDLREERSEDAEGQVLQIIYDLMTSEERTNLPIKKITAAFNDRYRDEYGGPITNKWIGMLVRKKLGLRTHKSHGNFVIAASEHKKLEHLYERYGTHKDDTVPSKRVDVGDVGDVREAT